jgi:ribonuclease BN (tRNA processing enzyme)
VYLPDHEPALGLREDCWPEPEWISGFDLAAHADLLIHDAQYTDEEYVTRIGWGHSTYRHALEFAKKVGAKEFVPFHHDPSHDDATLDRLLENATRLFNPSCKVSAGHEGAAFQVGSRASS